MNKEQKSEIEKIAKDFASGFKPEINEIAGSGWLIVDPLSGYLNSIGYQNKLVQIPEDKERERKQVLIIEFKDGDQFIPAGSDLPFKGVTDWMWL